MASTAGNQSKVKPGKDYRNPFELVTPEGVPLTLEVALAGDRLVAFLLDVLFIASVIFVLGLLTFLTGAVETLSILLLVTFFLRNFYFMFFEFRWQGATPGKRNRKLRVIDYKGGQLSVEAIIVRNLTRDIEIFIPLVVLLAPGSVWPGAPVLAAPLAGLWMVVLGLMPLFNRHRRRVGDLIAGTMVIASPQVELLGDLADDSRTLDHHVGREDYAFTHDQLSVYGIYELQVLEKVLRRSDKEDAPEQMATIREKICAKIDWPDRVKDDYAFLKAFYAAQRAHLEGRMLMGDRREDKFAGTDPAADGEE